MYQNVNCAYCSASILKRKYDVRDYKNSFCDKDCHAKFKIKTIEIPCGNCNTKVFRQPSQMARSKSGNVFCSRSCATIFNNRTKRVGDGHPNYTSGCGSYRARAIRELGPICSSDECPFDFVEHKMLDVHHRNGDRKDNELSNLQVLCVWCHAKVTRKDWT